MELSGLIAQEDHFLGGVQTEIEKKAGVKKFEEFGFYPIINALANGDILKWPEIMNLPYEKYYLKRRLNKIESEYNKKYAELLAKQN